MRLMPAAVLLLATLPAGAEIVLPDVPSPPAPGGAAPGAPAGTPAPAAKADPYGDRLRFAGGDMLRGSFVGFDAKDGLAWRHKDGLAVFRFRPDNLDRVEFSTFAPKPDASDLRLSLDNGDILLGKLVAFTPAAVVLDTWYAGRLTVPSAAVRSLAPVKNAQGFILAGFGKPEDWKVQNGDKRMIRIADGQMTLQNNVWVGRELDLPAKYKVELEAVGSAPNFSLGVLCDGVQVWGGNGYTFQFGGTNGYIQRCINKGNSSRSEGAGGFRYRQAEGNFSLSLFVDTEARQIALVVNGQKAATTAIPADFKVGKHLVLAGQAPSFRIARLRVEHWSGQMDEVGGAARRPTTDVMVLANKDQMSGQLLSIKDGKALFKAEFATMEVPLDRIRGFDLCAKGGQAPKPGKGAVQWFFNEGERLTLVVEGVKDGKVFGASPAFGPCTAELAAFQKAQFNLDAPFRAEAKGPDEGDEPLITQ